MPGIYQQGMNQQTPAVQTILRGSLGGGARSTSKRKSRTSARKTTKKAKTKRMSSAKSTAARFVKGSPAAKRFMAKLRKMRKK